MRDTTIARNYAEVLLELARRAGDVEGWGAMMRDVAEAVRGDERLRLFLESPRIDDGAKNDVLTKAFQDRMPRLFVRFLQTLVDHRRQLLIPEISIEYDTLLDEVQGRVHAQVTMAKEPSAADRELIASRLGAALGKTVVPHVTVDSRIIGGAIVRIGDLVMDGSVRRRLGSLRARLTV